MDVVDSQQATVNLEGAVYCASFISTLRTFSHTVQLLVACSKSRTCAIPTLTICRLPSVLLRRTHANRPTLHQCYYSSCLAGPDKNGRQSTYTGHHLYIHTMNYHAQPMQLKYDTTNWNILTTPTSTTTENYYFQKWTQCRAVPGQHCPRQHIHHQYSTYLK